MKPHLLRSLLFTRGRAVVSWSWLMLVLVLIGGAALTWHEWTRSLQLERVRRVQQFDQQVEQLVGTMRARLAANEQLLRAGAGLFSASDDVSRAEWHVFGQQMSLDAQYPGLQVLGVAQVVRGGESAALERRVRGESAAFRSFSIRPIGERAVYAPVFYAEPTQRGARPALPAATPTDPLLIHPLLGLDLLAQPAVVEAVQQARDSADVALSDKTVLPVEFGADVAQTMLIMPVYRKGVALESVLDRRGAIQWYLFALIRVDDFMSAVLRTEGDRLAVQLYAGQRNAADAEIFSLRTNQIAPEKGLEPLQRLVPMEYGQRTWTLQFTSLPEQSGEPWRHSTSVLIIGSILTLLLSSLLGLLILLRTRAETRADTLGQAYRRSEAWAQAIVAHSAEGIVTADAMGRVLGANAAAEAVLGYPARGMEGLPLSALLPLPLQQMLDDPMEAPWRMESAVRTVDARDIEVRTAASVMRLEGQRGFVVMLSDVTEQKRADQYTREMAQLNAAILQSAPFMVIVTDTHGRIRAANAATERMLWYGRDELVGRPAAETLMTAEELKAHAEQASMELGLAVPTGAVGARVLRGLTEEREWLFRRKDGSHLAVNMALAVMRGVDGKATGFVGIAYDISERKRSESRIRHLAHHDTLTDLPNRALLHDRVAVAIEHAKRNNRTMAVMLLDLDHFKQINDSLGHSVGDVVLKEVAARLRATVRQSDTVARMGGDEFCVVLSDVDGRNESTMVAQKIVEAVQPAIHAGERELNVTVSVGIALYPGDGADLAALLQNADIAMYEAKKHGRDAYRVFVAQMQSESLHRRGLEEHLRAALGKHQLVLHYQPRLDLLSGDVCGIEALLRWNLPGLDMLYPEQFLALAEETGCIVAMGEWVLAQACAAAVQLQQHFGVALPIAVNLSPRQFRHNNLLPIVDAALASSGLQPELLELDVTEEVLFDETPFVGELQRELQSRGVRLTIDDFGTGHASLIHLHRFKVGMLKVDRSLVSDLASNAASESFMRAVMAVARSVGLGVTAEGIESAEQLAALRRLGCPFGQGQYFCRPLHLDELMVWLLAHAHGKNQPVDTVPDHMT
ncbi:bifunctional diguanylate cyclase/phosphodiesterase [Variovorax sp. HJSM1_2]|uniref:bifunctional diguanylate cyclase/phosphodiesterase n=1 Tax=Variovorax sp. HJSM1_2 TaxID=3366263 RepID=UPI003BD10B95